jgi:PAX-interacting protein 1
VAHGTTSSISNPQVNHYRSNPVLNHRYLIPHPNWHHLLVVSHHRRPVHHAMLHQVIQQSQEQIQQQLMSLTSQSQVQPQLVTPKTKTALANLLNNRLQGSSPRMPDFGDCLVPPPTPPVVMSGSPRLPSPAGGQQSGTGAGSSREEFQRNTLRNITNSGQQQMSPRCTTGKPGMRFAVPTPATGAVQQQQPQIPRAQFYGHEPNIKVPPDFCLLGCVFFVVDYDKSIPQDTLNVWRLVVTKHGGETETTY